MISIKRIFLANLLAMALTSCNTTTESETISTQIEAIKGVYAPDKRVALIEVSTNKQNGQVILKGVSNIPEAITALKDSLNKRNITYTDSIELLPSADLNGKVYGIINNSVANLRGRPAHSSELVTQATLGTPVQVLQKEGSWYRIQTPDHYLSWVDSGGISLYDEQQHTQWLKAKKIIFLAPYGHAKTLPDLSSQTVSDLVMGAVLEYQDETDGFYQVRYPNGRIAYLSKDQSLPYEAWLAEVNPSQTNLVRTAKELMGFPYLWGGTSSKGMDCSGFTKTIYFMNGIIIPRDASQQIHTGELVDEDKNWNALIPGDLLFFGRAATDKSPERVIHVGMWIGNGEFIHASGRVRVSSMDPSAENYDAYEDNRYLRTKRLANVRDAGLLYLNQTDIY